MTCSFFSETQRSAVLLQHSLQISEHMHCCDHQSSSDSEPAPKPQSVRLIDARRIYIKSLTLSLSSHFLPSAPLLLAHVTSPILENGDSYFTYLSAQHGRPLRQIWHLTHIEDKKKKLRIQETNNPQKQNIKTIYSKETTHRSSGSYLFAFAVLMFSQGR